jgi:acetylornithine/N-succinyldiaminopimelate aminotransferase
LRTGLKKVFFGNSGAEANECAIKVARKYASEKKGKDCYKIITLKNSFHGRTITTLSATGQDVFHSLFNPLTEGFEYATANDFESVKQLVDKNEIAGILIECVQGEGGVIPLEKEFVEKVYALAKEKDIVFMVDEVQTGNGRCGSLYAYMQYGILPDVVTTAKGLGGGLPIGACIMGEKVESVLGFSDHGSTFGGNPIACASANKVLEMIDDNLLSEVNEKSKFVFAELKNAKGVKSVTGLGLMIGIETEKPVKEVMANCIENGVLPLTAKTKLRLLPPLNIPFELLKKAVQVIKKACE